MSNTSELLKALNNFVPRKKRIIIYRAYYEGTEITSVQSGAAEDEWAEGNWIEITRKEYETVRPAHDIIVDGKIITPVPRDPAAVRLEIAANGKFTSLKGNIIFAAKEGDSYKWRE